MKNKNITHNLLIALSLGLAIPTTTTISFAQDSNTPPEPPHGRPAHAQAGEAGTGRRPLPPIIATLDVNGDGILDAQEIANASAALLKLDKNGDGVLSADELRPARPQGGRGPGGPGGPGGLGGGPRHQGNRNSNGNGNGGGAGDLPPQDAPPNANQ